MSIHIATNGAAAIPGGAQGSNAGSGSVNGMKELYLLTGAAGHLGHTLARMLVDQGKHVRGLLLPNERHRLPQEVELFEGDVRDRASLEPFFNAEGYDRVVLLHAAAIVTIRSKPDGNVWDVNVNGTANILALCEERHIDRVIYVSSVHAIPERPEPEVIAETRDFSPEAVEGQYAKSKAAAARLALEAAERGLNLSVVHPSGIVGPGDFNGRNHLVATIRAAAQGKLPVGTAGGYDLVDVRDVAEGILNCVERGEPGACYILSGHPCTIRELFQNVAAVTGRKPPRLYLPLPVAALFAPMAEWAALRSGQTPIYTPYAIYTLGTNDRFSHQKATETWGYCPRPLAETLRDMAIDFFDVGQVSTSG